MNSPIRVSDVRARLVAAAILVAVALASPASAAPLLVENFDNVADLGAKGWSLINNSTPVGESGWFQGNDAVFSAFSGAADSYIAANFLGAGFGGDVSEWLVSPELAFDNGDVLTFYTRSAGAIDGVPGDTLKVLFNMTGGSSLSDFSTLLTVSSYPSDWTQYSVVFSGLAAPITTRFAFQYLVTDNSINGDYIGIDSVVVSAPEPSTLALLGLGVAMTLRRFRTRQQSIA
jgi:hypothetical protein